MARVGLALLLSAICAANLLSAPALRKPFTIEQPNGVILVDSEYCLGCRYCIQACPYGARYLDPRTRTAEKCTFCYHRIRRGLLPACVEVCPTRARVFGELRARTSPLWRLRRLSQLQVLKPYLNTEPRVLYSQLDGEVR